MGLSDRDYMRKKEKQRKPAKGKGPRYNPVLVITLTAAAIIIAAIVFGIRGR